MFGVASAGRVLRVAAPDVFTTWWPGLAPHVPGAQPALVDSLELGALPDVRLPTGVTKMDARRLVNAGLHRLHLRYSTVCIHAVAACADGVGVLLLGGHGAGKSLVGLALKERGWQILAGDVALVQAPDDQAPLLVGGTAAYMVRVRPLGRWFPTLAQTAESSADKLNLASDPALSTPTPLHLAVTVAVDGDPHRAQGEVDPVSGHTAASTWLRASAHLLDRVLDEDHMVLREFEDSRLLQRRMSAVRNLARQVPMVSAFGSPHAIATHVHTLMSQVPKMTEPGGFV